MQIIKQAVSIFFWLQRIVFFEFLGWYQLKVKTFKLQKEVFLLENRELSKQEYMKLVKQEFE